MDITLAYLDLGAGSMLLQILLAGILGFGFTIKTYWRRIVAWIRRDKKNDASDGDSPVAGEKS